MSRSPEEHLAEIKALLPTPEPELVNLEQAHGRRTFSAITAAWDSPRFDNSQMDGFALAPSHLSGGTFSVGPTIPAGHDPDTLYPRGLGKDIAPIMTGARLPKNTAAVIAVEKTKPGHFDAQQVEIPATPQKQFMRLQGSDIAAGEEIIPAGTVLNSVHLGVLASQSKKSVEVYKKPRVLIVTGGSEISEKLGAATIPDANGPLLRALCRRNNIDVITGLKTNDDPQRLRFDLEQAIDQYQPDAIITSGGISHGKFEVFRQILENTPEAWFGHVDQQPGGPQGISVFQDVPVISLPGNPISTLVSFTLFVAPALNHQPLCSSHAHITETVHGLKDNREQFLRGILSHQSGKLIVTPLLGTSSHLLVQAATANCLIRIPARTTVEENSLVQIYPFD
ncbi:molybdopterin bioynthesis protein MoeA [Corynebacterium suranareeae]|uniref:Molybdopterin molybdenumtransferase n=1 Tax=Corynebacterium suranareeae TaxID=2506452 RepID=A0A160PQQ7_9CORY|nr:molybdopterin molybdotransferase MoeA [Corynebacterium suranareeae]BAU94590.1 molybdopterin bioynthesis protein MoeA [Corynebacterium suranareeae]